MEIGKKKVLHIASYFARQSVYINLVREVSKYNVEQNVFVPVRTKQEIGRNQDEELVKVSYRYAHILRPWDRLFYFSKIKKVKRSIEQWGDLAALDIIHAHCLFSDGGVALLLKRKYGIKYVVAIRNTDFRFFRTMPHLKRFGLKILKEAEQVIHINPSYQAKLERMMSEYSFDVELQKKSVCIPNGVNEFWHKNRGESKSSYNRPVNLLFVGAFVPLKNVPLLIKAATILSERLPVKVTLIGGGGRIGRGGSDKGTLDAIAMGKARGLDVILVDRVNDLNILREFYRDADVYVMPSKPETFGLVYIEAMSQGTPVIYSKGHGIDGYFENGNVGYAIEFHTPEEVASKIQLILDKYEGFSRRCVEASVEFGWEEITKRYVNLYRLKS